MLLKVLSIALFMSAYKFSIMLCCVAVKIPCYYYTLVLFPSTAQSLDGAATCFSYLLQPTLGTYNIIKTPAVCLYLYNVIAA